MVEEMWASNPMVESIGKSLQENTNLGNELALTMPKLWVNPICRHYGNEFRALYNRS
jgi:hypothetical protein